MRLMMLLLAVTQLVPKAQFQTQKRFLDFQTVSRGNNAFTIHMYRKLAEQPGNVFFSPISTHAVLSLVSEGAAGETLDEIYNVLDIKGIGPNYTATPSDGYQLLMNALKHIKLHFHMAIKVYIQENYKMKANFKTVARKKFLSEAESINFVDNQNAVLNINRWCMRQTHGKIKDVIKADDFDELTSMVLLSAIYFKGDWLHKFNKTKTKKAYFHAGGNQIYNVDMMTTTSQFRYSDGHILGAKVLEMKYVSNDVSMVIILPNDKDGIGDLEKQLKYVDLAFLTIGLKEMTVDVSLPKFKMETTMPLENILQQMGIHRAFGPSADFSKLIESGQLLHVSKVIQKAFIEVNEEGAEAAAVSAVVQSTRSIFIPPQFHATHPFIFYILHNREQPKTVLFFGKVVHPESPGS